MAIVNLVKPKIDTFIIGAKPIKTLSMKTKNKSFGDIFIKSDITQPEMNILETRIFNSNGQKLGYEEFIITTPDEIEGLYILTKNEFKNKGGRIGELLRLTSIIEFLENKKSKFSLYSKETAIMFHSKYKFEPNIFQFTQRDKMLDTILKNKECKDEKIIEQATQIINKLRQKNVSNEQQRELCRETSILAKDYINYLTKNVKDPKSCQFEYGIDMVLTKEKVLENKDFFNELFKKHGIDYTI